MLLQFGSLMIEHPPLFGLTLTVLFLQFDSLQTEPFLLFGLLPALHYPELGLVVDTMVLKLWLVLLW